MAYLLSFAHGKLKEVEKWVRDSRACLRKRDRVDALDSLKIASRKIAEAEKSIRESLDFYHVLQKKK